MRTLDSILIVDDNRDTLDTIGTLFRSLDVARVSTADTAREALDMLSRNKYSVVVSDYMMPGMTGVDMIESMRSSGDKTPVLLVSGAPDTSAVMRALRQPKVAFFGKPFVITEITNAIDELREGGHENTEREAD